MRTNHGAAQSDALVLFGVTGDLAHKMIFPALYEMAQRGALRVPVLAYVVCLATMAAQAAAWWRSRAGTATPDATPDVMQARAAALGGLLFMASDSLLAINKFGAPVPLSSLWILATYWVAQWCIASALRPR